MMPTETVEQEFPEAPDEVLDDDYGPDNDDEDDDE